jgi:steroid delta-isomerase-like uncharacterized protein
MKECNRMPVEMPVEENIQLMRRWFQEVWNEGKTESIHELLAPDAIAIGQLEDRKELRGAAGFVSFVSNLRATFPNIKIKVEDVFGADDRVVLRWSATMTMTMTTTMTHTGNQQGTPAAAKAVEVTGITIARLRDGKIVEGWDSWDQLGMMKQIGAYVSPQPALLKSA